MNLIYYLTRIEHRLKNFLSKNKHTDVQEYAAKLLQRSDENELMEILFVCTGNICRSAYAHHALIKLLSEHNIPNVSVKSAGIATTPGKSADKMARKIAKKRGVNLDDHLTTFIFQDGLKKASLIVVMEPIHARRIMLIEPSIKNKIVFGGHLATENDTAIVSDPYGHSEEVFNKCFDILDTVVDRIINNLKANTDEIPENA